jgi:hypothetical protein
MKKRSFVLRSRNIRLLYRYSWWGRTFVWTKKKNPSHISVLRNIIGSNKHTIHFRLRLLIIDYLITRSLELIPQPTYLRNNDNISSCSIFRNFILTFFWNELIIPVVFVHVQVLYLNFLITSFLFTDTSSSYVAIIAEINSILLKVSEMAGRVVCFYVLQLQTGVYTD